MTTTSRTKIPEGPEFDRKGFSRWRYFPVRKLSWAAVPVLLTAWYLTRVAPSLVPVPAGVNVPFPTLTRALEETAIWSGKHPGAVWAVAGGLLAGGILFRVAAARYYVVLGIALTCGLAITYYSLSAPIDRLLQAIEENLPRDERVPGP